MSDRTSAGLFATVFDFLAEQPDERARTLARRLWDASGEYDFSAYQMGCDDALVTLGLAQRGVDPDYPNDGETVIYLDERGWVEPPAPAADHLRLSAHLTYQPPVAPSAPAPVAVERDLRAPAGYRLVDAEVWTNGTRIVVLGEPDTVHRDTDPDSDGWHNCDAMGCGLGPHVLAWADRSRGPQEPAPAAKPPSPVAPLTAAELDAIERRAEAATPGPWENLRGGFIGQTRGEPGDRYEVAVAQIVEIGTEPDAAFIAASREDVPRLLAEVRRLSGLVAERTAERDVLRALLTDAHRLWGNLRADAGALPDHGCRECVGDGVVPRDRPDNFRCAWHRLCAEVSDADR